MSTATIPADVNDPVNARILAVSEDRIQGFTRYPLRAIADASGQFRIPVAPGSYSVVVRKAVFVRS